MELFVCVCEAIEKELKYIFSSGRSKDSRRSKASTAEEFPIFTPSASRETSPGPTIRKNGSDFPSDVDYARRRSTYVLPTCFRCQTRDRRPRDLGMILEKTLEFDPEKKFRGSNSKDFSKNPGFSPAMRAVQF